MSTFATLRPDSSSPRPVERRQFGRRRTHLRAIVRQRGRQDIPCIVADISDGGALVRLEYPAALPPSFRLFIEADLVEYDCELRHQKSDDSFGVQFLGKRAATR